MVGDLIGGDEVEERSLPALQAVLWDMDGTLVDSEKVWAEVQLALLADSARAGRWKIACPLIGERSEGCRPGWMARIPEGAITAEELAERMFSEVVEALGKEVTFQPGALELLQALRKEEVPCALVSAFRNRVIVDTVLGHVPADLFDVIVAGDEVTLGKPEPGAVPDRRGPARRRSGELRW